MEIEFSNKFKDDIKSIKDAKSSINLIKKLKNYQMQ